ncbi:MAG TPA: hypothetical protein PKG83_03940 [bacterium]|nr:hypothetical protein [bacterium]
MLFKILKIGWLVLIAIILVLSGILFIDFAGLKAADAEYELGGWLWTETFGWISLNSDNCVGNSLCFGSGVDYKAIINSSDQISGYGWSEHVGWICFGVNCSGTTPDSGASFAQMDSNGRISGWAKVLSLDDDGWIDLGRGSSISGASWSGEQCYDCQPACKVWEMAGDPPSSTGTCLEYSDTEFDSCSTCFTRTRFDNKNIPDEAVDSVTGGSGFICSSCNNCQKVFSISEPEIYRLVCNSLSGGSCSSCELYGVNRNNYDGRLLGWAWNGDADRVKGAGWVNFHPLFGQSFIVYPWLETKYGSIYSTRAVRQKAGSENYNATYCIYAESINLNIKSDNCQSPVVPGLNVGFPAGATNVYRNALGKVDVQGLITEDSSIGADKNKYGHEIQIITEPSWLNEEVILAGKVYYRDGDLTVSNLTFNNALQEGEKGNGVVVVNGDLLINGNINYGTGSIMSPKQLASVAWLVKGDVIVDPLVSKIAGAMIILGQEAGASCLYEGGATCDSPVDYPEYVQNHYGIFFSGASNNPLTVIGLVVARAFDFDRTYADLQIGSEQIIYDGRLSANPPPGMEGFVEGLPVIRDLLIN